MKERASSTSVPQELPTKLDLDPGLGHGHSQELKTDNLSDQDQEADVNRLPVSDEGEGHLDPTDAATGPDSIQEPEPLESSLRRDNANANDTEANPDTINETQTSNSPINNDTLSSLPNPGPGPGPDSQQRQRQRQRAASGVIPPYWGHHRNASRASQASSLDRTPAITLVDHTEDPNSDTSRGLWAKSVSIEDYVIVNGMSGGMSVMAGVGAYVVWNCKVQMLEVCFRAKISYY